MNHFYKEIQGYFDFEDLYVQMVREAPENAKFVEIGVWKGRSAMFLAVEAINSNKNITLSCVDSWEFKDDKYEDHLFPKKKEAYSIFMQYVNILPRGVVTVHKMSSEEASKLYEDNSLDFVFVDGSHAYPFVMKDLESWYPKVKVGGVIAGHDRDFPEVAPAVADFFDEKGKAVEKVSVDCWLVRK